MRPSSIFPPALTAVLPRRSAPLLLPWLAPSSLPQRSRSSCLHQPPKNKTEIKCAKNIVRYLLLRDHSDRAGSGWCAGRRQLREDVWRSNVLGYAGGCAQAQMVVALQLLKHELTQLVHRESSFSVNQAIPTALKAGQRNANASAAAAASFKPIWTDHTLPCRPTLQPRCAFRQSWICFL